MKKMYYTITVQLKIIVVENSKSHMSFQRPKGLSKLARRVSKERTSRMDRRERERERQSSSSSSGERGRMQMLIALSQFRRKQDRCIDEFTRSRMIHKRFNHRRTSFQLATHCRQIYRELKVRTQPIKKQPRFNWLRQTCRRRETS